jgi:aryl-alcohol dehydrogenase-like predicted oxidoreductase
MDRREFLKGTAAVGGLVWTTALRANQDSPPALPTRPLGRTGVNVTVLALGGYTGMKEPRSDKFDPVELANAAIDSGIRYFDSAPSYGAGQSERNYGEVLAHRRKEVFLAGKTGQRTYDGAMREFEESLKRLRTDHVDLLQIHGARVGENLAAWGKSDGVVKALEKLRDQKLTRFIGVTGHESADLMCRAITMYDFDTVLTTFNPTAKRRPFAEKVLPLANRKGLGIQAMKVMGGALGSLAVGNPIKNDGKPHHDDAPQQATAGELIRYVLGLPISVAVVGMNSLEQLRINVAAAREAPLNEQQRRALETRMSDPVATKP